MKHLRKAVRHAQRALPTTLSLALEEARPCLFSAMHWNVPESATLRFAIVRAPFSICILSWMDTKGLPCIHHFRKKRIH